MIDMTIMYRITVGREEAVCAQSDARRKVAVVEKQLLAGGNVALGLQAYGTYHQYFM